MQLTFSLAKGNLEKWSSPKCLLRSWIALWLLLSCVNAKVRPGMPWVLFVLCLKLKYDVETPSLEKSFYWGKHWKMGNLPTDNLGIKNGSHDYTGALHLVVELDVCWDTWKAVACPLTLTGVLSPWNQRHWVLSVGCKDYKTRIDRF